MLNFGIANPDLRCSDYGSFIGAHIMAVWHVVEVTQVMAKMNALVRSVRTLALASLSADFLHLSRRSLDCKGT